MIRRLFWLTLGAVLGVAGYRRAAALARSLRPMGRGGGVGASRARGDLAGFAADVREGMALYMERQAARAPSFTLEGHAKRGLPRGAAPARTDEPKDGS